MKTAKNLAILSLLLSTIFAFGMDEEAPKAPLTSPATALAALSLSDNSTPNASPVMMSRNSSTNTLSCSPITFTRGMSPATEAYCNRILRDEDNSDDDSSDSDSDNDDTKPASAYRVNFSPLSRPQSIASSVAGKRKFSEKYYEDVLCGQNDADSSDSDSDTDAKKPASRKKVKFAGISDNNNNRVKGASTLSEVAELQRRNYAALGTQRPPNPPVLKAKQLELDPTKE